MTWTKLDDKFVRHPKVATLSDGAFRLHVSGLCYCSEFETDGKLSSRALQLLTPSGQIESLVQELVAARLWEPNATGWEIHDYLVWNPSKADLDERRRRSQERMRGVRANEEKTNSAVSKNTGPGCEDLVSEEKREGIQTVQPTAREPPATDDGGDGTRRIIATTLRGTRHFASLDVQDLAQRMLGLIIGKGIKLQWLLESITDCDASCPNGLSAEAKQKKLWGFAKATRPPRSGPQRIAEPTTGIKYREFEPDNVKPLASAKQAELAAKIAGIGAGGGAR